MGEMYLGELIRALRLERGITQEKLCDGICSLSTLSRIENGSQVASRSTFEKLMSRLGQPGFLYRNVLSSKDYRINELQQSMLMNLYQSTINFVEDFSIGDMLSDYKELVSNSNEDIFLTMMECFYIYRNCNNSLGYTRLQIGEVIVNRILFVYKKYIVDNNFSVELCFSRSLDFIELMLCNLLAIGEYLRGNCAKALEIEIAIYNYISQVYSEGWKKEPHLAFVCNNLSVFLIEMGLYREALIYSNKSVEKAMHNNSCGSLAIFLLTRSACYKNLKAYEKAYFDINLVRGICKLLYGKDGNIIIESKYLVPTQIF